MKSLFTVRLAVKVSQPRPITVARISDGIEHLPVHSGLDEPRSENSILNIVEQHDDVDEAKLRRDSTAATNQLRDDRSVRKAILEALSDILVADHNANRKPAITGHSGPTRRNVREWS
ncbi:hypothetical protein [Rhodococcus qingshengii]|uniref:Uncharacterized protein n=1 Tax=Rhodococcus qingshengii TaxID=334542 RepID=A0A2A5J0S5_RHOSG|nr:hypothetical protein [Rhodococcus qingshengii]PCK23185.1 hypothetical protein CHR55_30660 [Rhodococcus qingshengii]